MLSSLRIYAKNHSNQLFFRFAKGANQFRNILVFNGSKEQFRILTQALEYIVEGTVFPQFSEGELILTDHDGVNWTLRRVGTHLHLTAGGQPSTVDNFKHVLEEMYGTAEPKVGKFGIYFEEALQQTLTRRLDKDHGFESFDPLMTAYLKAFRNLAMQVKAPLKQGLLDTLLANRERISSIVQRYTVLSAEVQQFVNEADQTEQETMIRRIVEDGLREIELFNLIEIKGRRIEDLVKNESVWMKELEAGAVTESTDRNSSSTIVLSIGKSAFDQALSILTKLKAFSRLKSVLADLSKSMEAEQLEGVQKKLMATHQRIESEMKLLQEKWRSFAEHLQIQEDCTLEGFIGLANQSLTYELKKMKVDFAQAALADFQKEIESLRVLISDWRRLNQSQKTELPANLSLLLSEARGVRRYYQQRVVKVSKKILESAQTSARRLIAVELKTAINTILAGWKQLASELNVQLPDLNSPDLADFLSELDRCYYFSAAHTKLPSGGLETVLNDVNNNQFSFFQVKERSQESSRGENLRTDVLGILGRSVARDQVAIVNASDESMHALLFKAGAGRCFVEAAVQRGPVVEVAPKLPSPRRAKIQETLGILNYKKNETNREK